jgi:hypothetical protein
LFKIAMLDGKAITEGVRAKYFAVAMLRDSVRLPLV